MYKMGLIADLSPQLQIMGILPEIQSLCYGIQHLNAHSFVMCCSIDNFFVCEGSPLKMKTEGVNLPPQLQDNDEQWQMATDQICSNFHMELIEPKLLRWEDAVRIC